MLGRHHLFKTAIALDKAVRLSWLGPHVARFAYWIWDTTLDIYFALRSKLFGHTAIFDLFGRQVIMDLRDRSVTRVLYLFHEYEPLETRMFINLLKPGMTVIDIGANTGYYTLIAALSVGETGRIVAFEPYPGNVEILSRNVGLNRLDNVTIEAYAISDLDGVAKLYISNINTGDHRIYDGKDDELFNVGRSRQKINVLTTTLDGYINNKGIDVDLIKMDVQGAEYVALQGMKETLKMNQDIILMTEYWPYGLKRCGTEPIEFLRELNALGFNIFLKNDEGRFINQTLKEVNDSVLGADHTTLFVARDDLV